MKKMNLMLAGVVLSICFIACNDSGTDATKTDSPTVKTGDTGSNNANNNTSTSNNPTVNRAPLGKEDSTFAMKAAEGGMMEVESGNVALANSTNDRIKAFAQMMVTDHGKANSELMSLASSRGMNLPTALPADKQKHIDGMKKMQGKAFDKHYVDMMKNDHNKAISDFEKQASNGNDAELKAWAEKTLPTLKMHRDSVMALSKIKM